MCWESPAYSHFFQKELFPLTLQVKWTALFLHTSTTFWIAIHKEAIQRLQEFWPFLTSVATLRISVMFLLLFCIFKIVWLSTRLRSSGSFGVRPCPNTHQDCTAIPSPEKEQDLEGALGWSKYLPHRKMPSSVFAWQHDSDFCLSYFTSTLLV